MHRLLSREHDELIRRERALLENLRVYLARLAGPEEDQELLRRSLRQLEELFLLVVVGEFNAGKTAFLNALLGDKLLEEGVTPTTSTIHLLQYGEQTSQESADDDLIHVRVPVPWLREINLVDTPGTNAVIQRHQEITEHFVPRSDLVLFVTSVDRPFSESERTFLEQIRQWGKKVVIVLNKLDMIDDADDLAEIQAFVQVNAQQLLATVPQIFPVSSRLALRAKMEAKGKPGGPQGPDWEASRFGALESFILENLDSDERLRLKLANPLGVARRLIERYDNVIEERQELLQGDFQTLDTIDEQLAAYQVDMRRDYKYQRSRVDNVLFAMAERGDRFFEETLRLGRVFDLVNGEKVRAEFEREVVADTSREIERHVNDLIDWLVEKDYRQWRDVMEYLKRRSTQHADEMIGHVRSDFEFNRQSMLASVGREAQNVVDGYDREAESLKLAQEVQRAIIQTAAVEVGALGLGALLVAVLHTTLLDVTGILGAGAVAALGLYVLPYRRSKVKADLRQKIGELRRQLESALDRQFEAELADSVQRIREAVAPYTRFVRVEREKLQRLAEEMKEARQEMHSLRGAIRQLEQKAAPTVGGAEIP